MHVGSYLNIVVHTLFEDIICSIFILMLIETVFSKRAESSPGSEWRLEVATRDSSHTGLILIDCGCLSWVGTWVEVARRSDKLRRDSTQRTALLQFINGAAFRFHWWIAPLSNALFRDQPAIWRNYIEETMWYMKTNSSNVCDTWSNIIPRYRLTCTSFHEMFTVAILSKESLTCRQKTWSHPATRIAWVRAYANIVTITLTKKPKGYRLL